MYLYSFLKISARMKQDLPKFSIENSSCLVDFSVDSKVESSSSGFLRVVNPLVMGEAEKTNLRAASRFLKDLDLRLSKEVESPNMDSSEPSDVIEDEAKFASGDAEFVSG